MPTTLEKSFSSPEIPSLDGGDEHFSEHTQSLRDVGRRRGDIKDDLYQGRRIIDRDTGDPEGMVDIRSSGNSEAIVVDSKGESAPAYQKLMYELEAEIRTGLESGEELTNELVLKAVYEAVRSSMKYDLSYVNEFANKLRSERGTGGRKVNLGYYITNGKGVCRHMALACSWLGARAQGYGWIQGGKLTAEVNQRASDNAAHEWARYTADDGTVYILDPAQNYFGTLEESLRQRIAGQNRWEYFRDGERQVYESRLIGDNSVKHAGITEEIANPIPDQKKNGNYNVFQQWEVVGIHGREGTYTIISIHDGVARLVEYNGNDDNDNAQPIIRVKLTDLIPMESHIQDNAGQIERPELPDLPPPPPLLETRKQKEIADRIAEVEAQRADYDAQFQALRDAAGEYSQLLWQVGHYMSEKTKAQNRNDGRGSLDYERYAGEAYRKMPPEIADQWNKYWYLMGKISDCDSVLADLKDQYSKSGMITGVPWTPPKRSTSRMAGV